MPVLVNFEGQVGRFELDVAGLSIFSAHTSEALCTQFRLLNGLSLKAPVKLNITMKGGLFYDMLV